jgi:hypothetical protein
MLLWEGRPNLINGFGSRSADVMQQRGCAMGDEAGGCDDICREMFVRLAFVTVSTTSFYISGWSCN